MLTTPDWGADYFNLIGIDPGTHNLGVAIMSVDIRTSVIVSTTAFTLVANKMLPKDSWVAETHGDRYARIVILEQGLYNIFVEYQPLQICSESPFFNMLRPQAYGALVEILSAIRRAV